MYNTTHSISYVMALLATHPHWIKKITQCHEHLQQHFTLSPKDHQQLTAFFQHHGAQFELSSRLLQKKRWQAIAQENLLIGHFLSQDRLLAHWEAYHQSISLHQPIAEHPSADIVNYLSSLRSLFKHHPILSDVITYDITKHHLLSIKLNTQHQVPYCYIPSCCNDIMGVTIHVHPLTVVKVFTTPLSRIIRACQNNTSATLLHTDKYLACREMHLFSKHWYTNNMVCFKINRAVAHLLDNLHNKIIDTNTLQELNLNDSVVERIIKPLVKKGVIKIHPTVGERHAKL